TAMGELRTEARFPAVAPGRGHYESFFIRTFHPSEPLGAWIRYTVLKRPRQQPRGSLWFTLFDAAAEGPTAYKITFDPGDVTPDAYISVDAAGAFHDGEASGAAGDASWSLTFESPEPPLRHLPRGWMYRAPIPKTKLLSPYPAARFSGEVNVAGRRLELDRGPARGRRAARRLPLRDPGGGRDRPRRRGRAPQGLRRLGLLGPRRLGAPHGQLLDRADGDHRRARGSRAAPPLNGPRGRLRA